MFNDLIQEGKEILKVEEHVDEMSSMMSFSPYLYEDPEYARLRNEFLQKAEELNELRNECHGCVRAKAVSENLPFYEKDLVLPLDKDVEKIYQILDSGDDGNYTGAK